MKLKPKRVTAAIGAAFAAGAPIHGFDRITLWLDRSDLPIRESVLRRHCTELKVFYKPMKYNSNWKTKLEVHQPTSKFLRLLSTAIGTDINVHINSVEIACDIPAIGNDQSKSWLQTFLGSAQMRYQRQTVENFRDTWYFGRRTIDPQDDHSGVKENRGNKGQKLKDKRGNVMAVYADWPSKLNDAQPTKGEQPCLHIEWRSSGSAALAGLGIVSLADLILFNHPQFWITHVTLYQLPRRTDLGRLLAKSIDADLKVSGTALRKRATKWISYNSIDGKFVMHNALLTTKGINRNLSTDPFMDWLKKLVTSDQG